MDTMTTRREEECIARCEHCLACELRMIRCLLEAFFDTTFANDPIAPRLPDDWEDRKTYADGMCDRVCARDNWGGMRA